MDLTKKWYRSEFIQHEDMITHRSIENEFSFYRAIANGDIETVRANCNSNAFTNPEGMGKLSENALQNIKYHFVVTTAMMVRFCVSYGMELERAYGLSDFYILEMDKCTNVKQISELHDVMCLDLCNKMLAIKNAQVLSKPIVLCLDYIYKHIHNRITISELAGELNLSESYLSRLFKKEMGIPISDYINDLKIEKTCNMLQFSEYSVSEIAEYFSFASESYFIKLFQKKMGETPNKYRKSHFRTDFLE